VALSLEVKRPGREAGLSSPFIAEVKNAWSYTSTPQYVFMAWCLVKHRDNFTFLLLEETEMVCFRHVYFDGINSHHSPKQILFTPLKDSPRDL
jgi:hypothetical protein